MAPRSDSKDPLEALRALLVKLNLTTIEREISTVLAQAEQAAPGYSEFLRRALEVEETARTERRIRRRVRRSRLGVELSLDGFDFSARPQLSPQAVKELLTCRFVEERRNIILVGKPSLGKTTVARAIGHAASKRGFSVYSVSMEEMLSELHASRADGMYRKAFRRVAQPDLLVLDDAGFSTLGRDAANELFRVVCARHLQRSTIVLARRAEAALAGVSRSPAGRAAVGGADLTARGLNGERPTLVEPGPSTTVEQPAWPHAGGGGGAPAPRPQALVRAPRPAHAVVG